ncbi:hypothetical protein Tco_0344675 [Tanacetum coccineum]
MIASLQLSHSVVLSFTAANIRRCDLVICAGDCKEKLASGLLEPFVAHLKYAEDQFDVTFGCVNGLDEYSNKSAAYAYKGLQRVLETRKAVLQREQAMVYARVVVVGFETYNLAYLVCFVDAFGSPRLRHSCPSIISKKSSRLPNVEDSKHRGKLSHMKGSQDDNFDSSDSSSESDSGMKSARSLSVLSDSQLRTQDVLMVSESNLNKKKDEATCINELSDLYMVLERDTSCQETMTAWNPEMESKSSNQKIVKLDLLQMISQPSLGLRLWLVKVLKEKIPPLKQSRKLYLDQEARNLQQLKRQYRRENQRRIAERSALTSKTTKIDKSNAQLVSRDMKKSNNPVIKSSTIDRLSAAHLVNPKVLPTKSKAGNIPMKATIKKNAGSKLVSKPAKVTTKENVQRYPVDRRKRLDINTGKQLPKVSSVRKLGVGDRVSQIGVSTCPQLGNKTGVSETLHKPSLVLQRDKSRFVSLASMRIMVLRKIRM